MSGCPAAHRRDRAGSVVDVSSAQHDPSSAGLDMDPDDRVHHHARIEEESRSGPTLTLCGYRLPKPRPDAEKLPCCSLCALEMGGPCR